MRFAKTPEDLDGLPGLVMAFVVFVSLAERLRGLGVGFCSFGGVVGWE
jgi:hypothetical protein